MVSSYVVTVTKIMKYGVESNRPMDPESIKAEATQYLQSPNRLYSEITEVEVREVDDLFGPDREPGVVFIRSVMQAPQSKLPDPKLKDVIQEFKCDREIEILNRVKKVVAHQLYVSLDDVVSGANIYKDLGVDSLDAVEVVMALEEEFGICIDYEDAEKFCTVGDCVNWLVKNREVIC